MELFSDYRFYATEKEKLDKLPLVIGMKNSFYDRESEIKGNNLYLLPPCKGFNDGSGMKDWYWGKDSWTNGFYTSNLSGLFALTFAIQIGCEEIYLLGQDWGEINGHTHFYEDTNVGHIIWAGSLQTGVGLDSNGNHKTGRYDIKRKIPKSNDIVKIDTNHPDYWYNVYKQEKNVKIYNVSPQSKITTFEKIGYDTFYKKMLPESYLVQNQIRNNIRKILKEKL